MTHQGHSLAMALRLAYLSFHRAANACFEPSGVTADQYVLLVTLAKQSGLTQQEIARRISSDANTVRAMLVLLEKRGFVSRGTHASDGRALCVNLTRKGRRVCTELAEASAPLLTQVWELFEPRERETFLTALQRLAEVMAPARPSRRAASCAPRRTAAVNRAEDVPAAVPLSESVPARTPTVIAKSAVPDSTGPGDDRGQRPATLNT